MVDNNDLRPWSELHEALFNLIINLLDAIHYLMSSCLLYMNVICYSLSDQ